MNSLRTRSNKTRSTVFLSGSLFLVLLGLVYGYVGDTHSSDTAQDVMIMLDVSTSMQVLDMEREGERVSRLDYSIAHAQALVAGSDGTRFGVGIFAGSARGMLPLTYDDTLVSRFLGTIYTKAGLEPGTDMGKAIQYGSLRFDQNRKGIVLLYTDGGDAETSSAGDNEILRQGNRELELYIVGVGSQAGGPIPDGLDIQGNMTFKKHDGQTVMSRLDTGYMQELANEYGGALLSVQEVEEQLLGGDDEVLVDTEAGGPYILLGSGGLVFLLYLISTLFVPGWRDDL